MRATHPHAPALASGRWVHEDGDLLVASEAANPGLGAALACQAAPAYDSPRFAVHDLGETTVVLHRLEPAEVDNDLAELVANELARPGCVGVPRAFERCFAGVVLSSAPGPGDAWRAFYDNTLAKLEKAAAEPRSGSRPGPTGTFGGIYGHARGLVAGSSLLDVGTCFGFFPLLLRRSSPHLDLTALDISAPILQLAGEAGSRESAGTRTGTVSTGTVRFVRGDARELPFVGDSFDTVTALHLLEHLEPSCASRALREMCRVARRRVIVAVPLEEEPDPAFGHVQSFGRDSLLRLSGETGWRRDFEDYLGGWLLLEPARR